MTTATVPEPRVPLAPEGMRDVRQAALGVGRMLGAAVTPWRRPLRAVDGVGAVQAGERFPGDGLVPAPRWQWTHGIEVPRPPSAVWPWVAQIGADRGGFYSYELLENLVGCRVRNADRIHPEWALQVGDGLRLHPTMPPIPVVDVQPDRLLLAHAPATPDARGRWTTVTWLFLVEPIGADRSRVVSRYRCATSDDLATRVQMGPTLLEPIGGEMDREMLRGIAARVGGT